MAPIFILVIIITFINNTKFNCYSKSNNMASYSCDVCDIRFPFKSRLERHLMSESHQLFAEVVSDYKKQLKLGTDSDLSQME